MTKEELLKHIEHLSNKTEICIIKDNDDIYLGESKNIEGLVIDISSNNWNPVVYLRTEK